MDKNKLKKIIAIVITTVISLIGSIIACVLELPTDDIPSSAGNSSQSAPQ